MRERQRVLVLGWFALLALRGRATLHDLSYVIFLNDSLIIILNFFGNLFEWILQFTNIYVLYF